jgi:hypothetical protein
MPIACAPRRSKLPPTPPLIRLLIAWLDDQLEIISPQNEYCGPRLPAKHLPRLVHRPPQNPARASHLGA